MSIKRLINRYTVFISSPSDVSKERGIAIEIIDDHNRSAFAQEKNYRLEPLGYEKYTAPSVGSPQLIIDKQMDRSDECDLVICILWHRMGTPTHDPDSKKLFPSGTALEFARAYRAFRRKKRPQIMLYRCIRAYPTNVDQQQLKSVNTFFQEIKNSNDFLYGEYETLEDFEYKLRQDLDRQAKNYITFLIPKPPKFRTRMLDLIESFWIKEPGSDEDFRVWMKEENRIEIEMITSEPGSLEKKATKEDQTLFEVFNEKNRQLVILGGPGSGKTIAMLEILDTCIHEARKNASYPIPVIFNAASWMEKKEEIYDWLIDELQKVYSLKRRGKIESAEWMVRNDKMIVCIDGLDEIKPRRSINDDVQATQEDTDTVDLTWLQDFIEKLNKFLQNFPTLNLIITCRSKEYEHLPIKLNVETTPIWLQPLSQMVILRYLSRSHLSVLRAAYEQNAFLQKMAQTPFLLSTMAIGYQNGSPGASFERITYPKDFAAHYNQLFDYYVRESLAAASSDATSSNMFDKLATQHYLGWLARQLEGQRSLFLVDQIQPSWLNQDGASANTLRREYLFAAGALIALFVAIIVALPCSLAIGFEWAAWGFYYGTDTFLTGLKRGLAAGAGSGVAAALLIFVGFIALPNWKFAYIIALALAVARGLLITLSKTDDGEKAVGLLGSHGGLKAGLVTLGVGLPLLAYALHRRKYSRDDIRPLEVVEKDWSKGWWGIPTSIIVAGIFSFVFDWGRGLAFGVSIGMTIALIRIVSGTSLPAYVRPNQGIIQSAKHAGFIGTVLAGIGVLCFGIFYGIKHGSIPGIVNGILGLIFSVISLIFGIIPVLQHYGLRIVLWRKEKIPLRWIEFLDYAAQCHLLRRVGGGYSFWHEYLREYFKKF